MEGDDLDDLQLLAIVGKSQIGRLRYFAEGETPGGVPAQDLESILKFDGAEDLFEDLMVRYAVHSGVSGLQPKVLLREAGSAPERLSERGATHIVKSFDPRRYQELAANEYFCLQAAQGSKSWVRRRRFYGPTTQAAEPELVVAMRLGDFLGRRCPLEIRAIWTPNWLPKSGQIARESAHLLLGVRARGSIATRWCCSISCFLSSDEG